MINPIKAFILGAGGHAKVLIDCLKMQTHVQILGILDVNPEMAIKNILGVPLLGSEEILANYEAGYVQLINGVGSVHLPTLRSNIFLKFKRDGYQFLEVIHPNAYLGMETIVGEGAQIMAGCIIQPGCKIGKNVIVNTHATVDHDCEIGDHVHLAPGVICCGNVEIGSETHIGCGAVIRQGIKIGKGCFIAAGAVITQDVRSGERMAGVPAKKW